MIPDKDEQSLYRSTASGPGVIPVLFIPTFRSIKTGITIPASDASVEIAFAAAISSTKQENFVAGYFFIKAISLLIFGPTGWYANNTSGAWQLASISASAIVAHLNLLIPAAICINATSFALCVLTCGRKRLTSSIMLFSSSI